MEQLRDLKQEIARRDKYFMAKVRIYPKKNEMKYLQQTKLLKMEGKTPYKLDFDKLKLREAKMYSTLEYHILNWQKLWKRRLKNSSKRITGQKCINLEDDWKM